MSSKEQIHLFTVEDHSTLSCNPDSVPAREEWEAVEIIGAVLCDLFFSLYCRPISACYAHVNVDLPRAFSFGTYYPDDFQTSACLREFFNVLAMVGDDVPGIVVSKERQVISAARFSDYSKMVFHFLGSVIPKEGQEYMLRALPEDIDRIVRATNDARHGKKGDDPFYSFQLH